MCFVNFGFCFRRIPFTIYPEWILAEAKEDRITETSNNLERVEQVQVKRFLAWVEEKILTIEPSNIKRRYELFRAGDLDLGPLHVDIVVHRGPVENGEYVKFFCILIFYQNKNINYYYILFLLRSLDYWISW
jgi:hypothetical protein